MRWNWRTGLLAQARSDYRMYLRLNGLSESIDQCHSLHFLQMATEKLAKGLMSNAATPPALTHKAFQRFVQQAYRHESIKISCGFEEDEAGFILYLRGIQAVARSIENLAPSGIESPNPEYPWEERRLDGNTIQIIVHTPESHRWLEWDMRLPEIIRLLEFLEGCFRVVEQELLE